MYTGNESTFVGYRSFLHFFLQIPGDEECSDESKHPTEVNIKTVYKPEMEIKDPIQLEEVSPTKSTGIVSPHQKETAMKSVEKVFK